MWRWEKGEYPQWYKAKVIAWYRGHRAVDLHAQDAQAQKARQMARQKGRR